KSDARCVSNGGEGLPDGASLLFTTSFGALESTYPATIDKNQPLSFTLLVRDKGDTRLAILDTTTLQVTVSPPAPLNVDVAGDGKFLTIAPTSAFAAANDGTLQVSITAKYLVNLDRDGLKLSGGTVGGDVTGTFAFTLRMDEVYPLPLPV